MTDNDTATATATEALDQFSDEEPQNPEDEDDFAALRDETNAVEIVEVPVTGPDADYTKPMTLGDFSKDGDLVDIPPAWVKLGAKPTTLRILYRMPTPQGYEPGNDQGRIPVYARFKVQYHGTLEERVWDVSSKRLLALLAGVPNLRDWFHVTRQGSGNGTTYTAKPGIAPKTR